MHIEVDDLSRPAIHALLEEHLRNMREISPPESVHALDLGKLRSPDITFWTAWQDSQLVGCGALKELDRSHGEIKSSREEEFAVRAKLHALHTIPVPQRREKFGSGFDLPNAHGSVEARRRQAVTIGTKRSVVNPLEVLERRSDG